MLFEYFTDCSWVKHAMYSTTLKLPHISYFTVLESFSSVFFLELFIKSQYGGMIIMGFMTYHVNHVNIQVKNETSTPR